MQVTTPHIVIAHDQIGGPTGMGLFAERCARAVLDRGWRLTLVASGVHLDLADECEIRPAPWPERPPALVQQLTWATRAGRILADFPDALVHVHIPSLIRQGHLLTVHHLAWPAYRLGVRERGRGLELLARQAQDAVIRHVDDLLYRTRPPSTLISFASEFLAEEFRQQYGQARGGWALPPPAPVWRPVQANERTSARRERGVPERALVVGFLGGDDPRKGIRAVIGLEREADMHLLLAGRGSERLRTHSGQGLGHVDVDAFLPACDVVVAPALFDAAPVAVLQSLARDIPVVVRPPNGWARAIERDRAGVVWSGESSLADAIRAAHGTLSEGRQRFTDRYSAEEFDRRLGATYDAVLATRRR